MDAIVVALGLSERDLLRCRRPPVAELGSDFIESIGLTEEFADALSSRFTEDNVRGTLHELRQFLSDKVKELLERGIFELGQSADRISNLMGAARAAIARGRFTEADASLRLAEEMQQEERTLKEVRKQAEIRTTRGDAALLRGDAHAAYAHFATASDLFGPMDVLEGAKLRHTLYERLHRHGVRYPGPALELAVALLQVNAATYSKRDQLLPWAVTHRRLGMSLYVLGGRSIGVTGERWLHGRARNLNKTVYSPFVDRQEYVRTLNTLGNTFMRLGFRKRGAEADTWLAQGAEKLDEALGVIDRQESPNLWTMTNNNLANILRIRGERTSGPTGYAMLARSVKAYREVLTIRDPETHPLPWALAQMNLGSALSRFADRTSGTRAIELLHESIASFERALTIRTETTHPVGWSEVQWGVGVSYRMLGCRTTGRTGDRLLRRSLAAFELALSVSLPADQSLDRAMILQERAITLREIAKRTKAIAAKRKWLDRAIQSLDHALAGLDRKLDRSRYTEWEAERAAVEKMLNARHSLR